MTVTLQQLRYFLAVADVRSFTRAAEVVGVAQPTLSRQLKAASASGARNALIIRKENLPDGEVTLRNLESGDERSLPFTDIVTSLNEHDG